MTVANHGYDEGVVRTFLRSFVHHSEHGCWPWIRACTNQGYGAIWIPNLKKPLLAHRVSHELFIGPIPDGMLVLHSCHNKPCIRPGHLRIGTHADNRNDTDFAGEAHPHAMVPDHLVREAMAMKQDGLSGSQIAQRIIDLGFPCSKEAVNGWLRGQYRKSAFIV